MPGAGALRWKPASRRSTGRWNTWAGTISSTASPRRTRPRRRWPRAWARPCAAPAACRRRTRRPRWRSGARPAPSGRPTAGVSAEAASRIIRQDRNHMFAAVPNPIPARMKGLNRAEICDVNFQEFVRGWNGSATRAPGPAEAVLEGSALDAQGFRELFESQLISRHLDLMARVLRVQNKVFYTIGSSGHEGNAMVARATRHTDPAFLHYRSGGFMAERFRKLPGMDPVMD